ncbi:MAG TPA: hypothetical protein VJG67_00695 [Candidatus Paceibacterota bacterium]
MSCHRLITRFALDIVQEVSVSGGVPVPHDRYEFLPEEDFRTDGIRCGRRDVPSGDSEPGEHSGKDQND